ncbi:MAG: hypothetical protein U9Q79_01575 [Candidatus Hydrogenedentes bacterium]|nr:hypothetical protein [Candidatus Hydrogenedentota bacterium]
MPQKKGGVRQAGGADIVILDDADLGFRDTPEAWPFEKGSRKKPSWIVLKMARPIAQGPLWEYLCRRHSNRFIVVMTVNDLRLTEVHISRDLSWERTAQDLYWELTHNPRVNGLSQCAHVLVSLGISGVFLLSRIKTRARKKQNAAAHKCTLLFDPAEIEDAWTQKYPQYMIGYTSCLTAAVAGRLMRDIKSPDLGSAAQVGLQAIRTLHLRGYDNPVGSAECAQLAFPLTGTAEVLTVDTAPFAEVEVQNPVRFLSAHSKKRQEYSDVSYWTILHERCRGELEYLAREIVLSGTETALQGVPLGKFGHLITADRSEIESLRSIANLMREYCLAPQKRPLSVAVFGPPGAGKSFGVTQVAKAAYPGAIEIKSFNLSQFAGPEDLLDALHQVRDIGLKAHVPLVFWDEFDTSLDEQPLGWLRYFLAPMQDGEFQEGQITHPIGKSLVSG